MAALLLALLILTATCMASPDASLCNHLREIDAAERDGARLLSAWQALLDSRLLGHPGICNHATPCISDLSVLECALRLAAYHGRADVVHLLIVTCPLAPSNLSSPTRPPHGETTAHTLPWRGAVDVTRSQHAQWTQYPLLLLALRPSFLFQRSSGSFVSAQSVHDDACSRDGCHQAGAQTLNAADSEGEVLDLTGSATIVLTLPDDAAPTEVSKVPSTQGIRDPLSAGDFMTWLYLTLFAHPGGIVHDGHTPVHVALTDLLADCDIPRLARHMESSASLARTVERTLHRTLHSPIAHSFLDMQYAASETVHDVVTALALWHPSLLCEADPFTRRNVWHVAAETMNAALIQAMTQQLHSHSCLWVQDRYGWTPLHMAARNADAALFDSIASHAPSAALAQTDWRGRTAQEVLGALQPVHGANPSVVIDAETLGAWPADLNVSLVTQRCDIAQAVGPLSSAEFIADYVSIGRPVIIRNGRGQAHVLKQWTAAYLREQYGDLVFPITTAPYSQVYGSQAANATLAEYIDWLDCQAAQSSGCRNFSVLSASKPYLFTELNEAHYARFAQDLGDIMQSQLLSELPRATAAHRPQLYVGPSGSGAQMHFHQVRLCAAPCMCTSA